MSHCHQPRAPCRCRCRCPPTRSGRCAVCPPRPAAAGGRSLCPVVHHPSPRRTCARWEPDGVQVGTQRGPGTLQPPDRGDPVPGSPRTRHQVALQDHRAPAHSASHLNPRPDPHLTSTLGSWVTPQLMEALVPLMTLWSCGGSVMRVRAVGGKDEGTALPEGLQGAGKGADPPS